MGQFVAKVLAAPLSQAAVTLLDQHIEGWIAGLRLATLSLRGVADAESAVTSLAVSHSDITDYLIDQELSQQRLTYLKFLLVTSILNRFCYPLCESSLASSSAAMAPHATYTHGLSGWSGPTSL